MDMPIVSGTKPTSGPLNKNYAIVLIEMSVPKTKNQKPNTNS